MNVYFYFIFSVASIYAPQLIINDCHIPFGHEDY